MGTKIGDVLNCRPQFKGLFIICAIVLGYLQQGYAANSNSWELLSPSNNADIKSGELFIAVGLKDDVKIKAGSVQFYIDDYLVTKNVKVSKDKITLLYLLPLKNGKHTIEIKGKATGVGWMKTLTAIFYVGRTGPDRLAPMDTLGEITESKVQLSGSLITDYTKYNVTGPGASIRQAVPYVYNVNLNTTLKIGSIRFPVKYLNTSDQYNFPVGIQPRNYFQAGVESNTFGLTYGDMNPVFDRLALTGTRIHGYKFAITRPRFNMQVLHGDLQRGGEGQLKYFNPASGEIPPPTLRGDSSYIIPGYYRRKISAARLAFGNKNEGSTLGLNFVKVKDDTSSIKYGTKPIDNLVASIDETFITNGSKLKIQMGAAVSLLTNDVSQGVAEKRVIDSITGTDYHIDPKSFEPFLVLNASTVKPGKASTAAYLTTILRGKHQTFTVDARYVGSAFRSFGNPFLRSDIQSASVQDQVNLWKRRILLTGRYLFQQNNLSNTLPTTLRTQSINGNLVFAPSPKLPQLGIMYYSQLRKTPKTDSKFSTVDDQSNTLSTTLNYNITTGKSVHGINLQYTQTKRIDQVRAANDNSTYVYGAGLMEMIKPLHIDITLRYNKLLFENEKFGRTPLSDVYEARLRYEWKKIKTFFSVGAHMNRMSKTAFSTASERVNYRGTITCQAIKNMILEVEGGYAPFTDFANSLYSYNEEYYTARLIYNFDFK